MLERYILLLVFCLFTFFSPIKSCRKSRKSESDADGMRRRERMTMKKGESKVKVKWDDWGKFRRHTQCKGLRRSRHKITFHRVEYRQERMEERKRERGSEKERGRETETGILGCGLNGRKSLQALELMFKPSKAKQSTAQEAAHIPCSLLAPLSLALPCSFLLHHLDGCNCRKKSTD